MSNKGFSHIGLSTHDLDATMEFLRKHPRLQGGALRHHQDQAGRQHPPRFHRRWPRPARCLHGAQRHPRPARRLRPTGINKGLGIPGVFYHFAFEAGNLYELNAKREELIGKGVRVTDIVDHEWAMSIYFEDPNGISLEYCCLTRDIGTLDDITFQERFERSIEIRNGQPVFVRDVQPDPLEAVLADD